jgi:hypothetical protein
MYYLFHSSLILTFVFIFSETGSHATFLLEFRIVVGFRGQADCVDMARQLEIFAHKEKGEIVEDLTRGNLKLLFVIVVTVNLVIHAVFIVVIPT